MGTRGAFSITDDRADALTTVLSVTGEVDMKTSPSFQRGLLRAIGAGKSGLVVDLSRVEFVDSAALTSLASAFDALRRRGGGSLAIVAPDSRMRALFEVARLDREFQIYDSRAEALEGLSAVAQP